VVRVVFTVFDLLGEAVFELHFDSDLGLGILGSSLHQEDGVDENGFVEELILSHRHAINYELCHLHHLFASSQLCRKFRSE